MNYLTETFIILAKCLQRDYFIMKDDSPYFTPR